jgi:hypothetical protein
MWGGWGIYSPNPQNVAVGSLLPHGAPDTVRCASHISQPLGFDRWSSDLWGLWAVRCANCACSDLCARRRTLNVLQSTIALEVAVAPLAHRTVRCVTGHCLVPHRTVR